MLLFKPRPYQGTGICDCGSQIDRRSQRCKPCQFLLDKTLQREHDNTLTEISGHPARRISLTKGQFAYVSPGKWEKAAEHNWNAWWNVDTQSYYGTRRVKSGGKSVSVMLHNFIFGEIPLGKIVDHASRITLDCTDENLRLATPEQNRWNRAKSRNNTSGHKGVTWHKAAEKWMVQIRANGTPHYLGLFKDFEEACRVYREAADKYHGEFACY